jgi:hypothetical protein
LEARELAFSAVAPLYQPRRVITVKRGDGTHTARVRKEESQAKRYPNLLRAFAKKYREERRLFPLTIYETAGFTLRDSRGSEIHTIPAYSYLLMIPSLITQLADALDAARKLAKGAARKVTPPERLASFFEYDLALHVVAHGRNSDPMFVEVAELLREVDRETGRLGTRTYPIRDYTARALRERCKRVAESMAAKHPDWPRPVWHRCFYSHA